MTKTILITGASSGIGAACVQQAAKSQLNVIATARSQSKLQQLQNQFENVEIVVADIATDTGRNIIVQSLTEPRFQSIDFLLHNAAILDAPQEFSAITLPDFRNNIVTNVEPILFLTQKLIPHFKAADQTGRILSVSSGAAKYAIAGMANYCVSKAAALMANQVLKAEMPKNGVIVNDYFPGVVDTGMQKTLRKSDNSVFPHSDDFKELKETGKLANPLNVAESIINIFTNTDDQSFAQSEWLFTQPK